MFPKVKNVNVESLKNGSKLLVFWRNFSTKRLREEEWEGGRERKTRGRERKTRGRERKTRGREIKI